MPSTTYPPWTNCSNNNRWKIPSCDNRNCSLALSGGECCAPKDLAHVLEVL
jgi:hypothetical protein